MVKIILTSFFSLLFLYGISADPFTVMTYNIRYDNPNDAPNHWAARKSIVNKMLTMQKPSIMGVQEALHKQLLFLDTIMKDYHRIGVARDDGKTAGEYSALFVDKKRFEIIDSGTLWLSETPSIPSLGWDAACKRVMTWAKLKDIKSGTLISVFNTHFDHVGVKARANSAALVVEKIKQIGEGSHKIFMGDLNAIITDSPIQYIIKEGAMYNSRDCAKNVLGDNLTYHDYGRTNGGIIDYIMVSDGIDVLENRIITDKIEGLFLSDHNPVIVKLKYKK